VERAVRALLATVILSALAVGTGATASAQSATVSLRLLRQTPWSSSYGNPNLRISVDATNNGTTKLGDLSLDLTIGANYDSRVEFETSLDEGPTSSIFHQTQKIAQPLPGLATETFTVKLDLSTTPGIDQNENLVYPASIALRSGSTTLASLTTPILYFVRQPFAPMLFTSWIQLEPTIAFGADGRLDQIGFPAALSPGGQLGAPIAALDQAIASHPNIPTTTSLVITPSLLEQAQRMVGGYTRIDGTVVGPGEEGPTTAAAFLASLKRVMGGSAVGTVATPFSGPTLSSMLNSNLGKDLSDQQTFGVGNLQTFSGQEVDTQAARPVNGNLSDEALDWLAEQGATTILGDTNTVDRVSEASVPGEPAPTATLSSPSGAPLTVILPDPSAQGLLERTDLASADPVRAAQAVLGELAVEWKEAPVPEAPNVRGRALALPSTLPPGIWAPLLERLRGTPFLDIVDPSVFGARVYPPGAPATLREPDLSAFPTWYTDGPNGIRDLGRQIADYASMLGAAAPEVPLGLTKELYYAEAQPYVDDPTSGVPWLGSISATTQAAFQSVQPQVSQTGFTFTSGEGTIPFVIGGAGPYPLTVTVRLEGPQFDFPKGREQIVVVTDATQVVKFDVVAKATGQNPIVVRVLAPNGDGIGQAQTIVVRSTAFNHIALIVTLAAAGVLAMLYSRRWFRRTTGPT